MSVEVKDSLCLPFLNGLLTRPQCGQAVGGLVKMAVRMARFCVHSKIWQRCDGQSGFSEFSRFALQIHHPSPQFRNHLNV